MSLLTKKESILKGLKDLFPNQFKQRQSTLEELKAGEIYASKMVDMYSQFASSLDSYALAIAEEVEGRKIKTDAGTGDYTDRWYGQEDDAFNDGVADGHKIGYNSALSDISSIINDSIQSK